MSDDVKAYLQQVLNDGRATMLWKLDGLSEYDLRRPMTPTGTNLLGLVKHLAGVELGYFGVTFGRPSDESSRGFGPEAEPDAHMWATVDESRDDIVAYYRRVIDHADGTIAALDLDAPGHVAFWPESSNPVTLYQILAFVISETHRHAGHADIIRELIDGSAGFRSDLVLLADADEQLRERRHEHLERVARDAADRYS